MPLSNAQKGAIGQFIFLATALTTGNGQVEVYTPAADNEGRDAEVRRHLRRTPAVGIQIKVSFVTVAGGHGLRQRYLVIRFDLRVDRVVSDPRLWYFFGHYDRHALGFGNPCYLMRSDVLYKLARRHKIGNRIWFTLEANLGPHSRDRYSQYRVAPLDLGGRLLEIIDDAPLTASYAVPELPIDAVLVSRPIAHGATRWRMLPLDRKYSLVREAVLERNSLSARYKGHLRLFSPFLLGTKAGDPHVLGYQFGGTSEKALAPDGSPQNWRCLRVAELTELTAIPGIWHAAPMGKKGHQHCIDQVDVTANFPSVGNRQLRLAA